MNGGLERIDYITVSTFRRYEGLERTGYFNSRYLGVCGDLERTDFTFSSLGRCGCHERTDF